MSISSALTTRCCCTHPECRADWIELDGQALRQYINAKAVFEACDAARLQELALSGGMLWRASKGHEYLIQTSKDNRQRSLGRRSAATEATYQDFTSRKRKAQDRVRDLRHEMVIQHRLNRALRIGRAPPLLVRILAALDRPELRGEILVAGDVALLAYETRAGVRLAEPVSATFVEPAVRHSIQLLVSSGRTKEQAYASLRTVDKTFTARPIGSTVLEVTNARGWVLAIRQDVETAALFESTDTGATWRFSVPVVSETGRMARMNTVAPCFYLASVAQRDLDSSVGLGEVDRGAQRDGIVGRLVERYFSGLCDRSGEESVAPIVKQCAD